jgi:hypothetical protein
VLDQHTRLGSVASDNEGRGRFFRKNFQADRHALARALLSRRVSGEPGDAGQLDALV